MKKERENKSIGLFSKPSTSQLSRARKTRPFLVVVTVVMIGIYAVAMTGFGAQRTPLHVSVLTGLMVVHLVFYWCLLLLPEKTSAYVGFLIVQSALAFALTLLTGQATLSLGLYSPLVGVAVGSLRNQRWTVLVVLGIVGLAALSVFLLPDSNIPTDWFWVTIPVMLFAHLQLSEYAAQLEDLTLANERQRLARELHDTLAQGLVGLILQLEATASHLQNGHYERAQEIVRHAMSRARETLADARRAISDLREIQARPGAGDVVEIVRTEAQRFTTATGIPCKVDAVSVTGVPERISEHAQRIVSEALSNVARHAQAQQTWVSLSCRSECLNISIRDDGIGFDLGTQTPSSGHYGLLGMRERARLAGGRLNIESAPGIGTTIELTLPLKVKREGA